MPDGKPWMGVPEAAALLGMDESTVYRLCRARKIRHRRIGAGGGRIAFTREDVASYLDSCVVPVAEPEPPPAPPAAAFRFVRPQGGKRAGSR